ncbi:hypothetical protein ES703_52045 [subsurface metagenome]
MKEGEEERIVRVYQQYDTKKTPKGKRYYGPYWYGYFQENGKEKRVFIGKQLPDSMKYLIKERFKRPGYKNYTWPGRKRIIIKKGGIGHGAVKI